MNDETVVRGAAIYGEFGLKRGLVVASEQRVSMLERLTDLYGFHTDAIYNVNSLRILSEIF